MIMELVLAVVKDREIVEWLLLSSLRIRTAKNINITWYMITYITKNRDRNNNNTEIIIVVRSLMRSTFIDDFTIGLLTVQYPQIQ